MLAAMPRTQATPEQKAEVRRKIRQAAADVYNGEGPSGVSVRAIAKRAEVSVGTIYTYFGSLQGLMESLWSGPVARYSEHLKAVAKEIKDPAERLRALMRAYILFAFENHEIYRGVFLYVRPLNMVIKDKNPAEQAVFASLVIEAIQEGQAAKKIRDGDPNQMALMIWGGLHGCLALPHNFGRMEFGNIEPVLEGFVETIVPAIER